ncbi:MAG: Hsp20/alpha crystallin family protein [Desulfosudaceae bacterium]
MNTLMPIFANNRLNTATDPERSMWDHLFGNLNQTTFREEAETWIPAIDMAETEKEYTIKAELPGMKKDDIDISLTDDFLTVRGEKKYENKDEKESYYYRESGYGSFSRSLKLPEDASPEEVDATYSNGVLKVVVPKKEAAQPKKISVN